MKFYILAKRSGSLYGLPDAERPLKIKGKVLTFETSAAAVAEARRLNKETKSFALSYSPVDSDGNFVSR